MIKKIGFVGLGTVGRYLATNLMKGHYDLTVFDSNPEEMRALENRGAKGASDPAEAARDRDMVIVILSEKEQMQAAIYGEKGILKGIAADTILVDMGTHSLEATLKLAEEAARRRVMFLEAPVWGTREHAADGLVTLLVGGDPALLGRCREAFSHFALNIINVGNLGDGTRMKYVVNLVQAELMEALAEGLVLGNKLGFSAEKVLEVLESGGVASPLFTAKGRSISRGDFSRNLALKYVFEGLQQAKGVAREADLDLPGADAASLVYARAVESGRGEEDFSAVVKVLRE
ncbi:MAG: NAD(P)-dependent oxidoreductase [Desulfuromonas sp.]|uniref:NAD(P)-dependent oxidoreductase n=1 Tax=Desulfuromonas sp. TaxID=892 RepID=UPI000CB1432B|nr:NAD(P)-dependent oxidoreductase [Desulfuromonas sp.]PLX85313.1 MAG: NAD(P)-dependent oxidoreductase [Desulfuromonas sp.]